jgi:hypothetical protein
MASLAAQARLTRARRGMFVIAGLALAALVGRQTIRATPADPATPVVQPQPPAPRVPFEFNGVRNCSGCHTEPSGDFKNRTDWCHLREFRVWAREDKHARGYAVLTTEGETKIWLDGLEKLSADDRAAVLASVKFGQETTRRMEAKLGWKPGEAASRAECLACHAMAPMEDRPMADIKSAVKDGVSCEVCHGPGGVWTSSHTNRERWWTRNHAERSANYGYRDVRDPVARATLCASCHVGSPEVKGEHPRRFVTHDMYDAGHPPLPSFEIGWFSESMPAHWRTEGEKPATTVKQYRESAVGKADAPAAEATKARHVLIGALVSLRQSALLAKTDAEAGRWPELSHFNCYACHQSLTLSPARRPFPKLAGLTRGRPFPHLWTANLNELAAPGSEAVMERFRAAMTGQVYGDAKNVAEASKGVADWCDQALAELGRKPVSKEQARQLLKSLANLAASRPMDYDSARQLAWAYLAIRRETLGVKSGTDLTTMADPAEAALRKRIEEAIRLDLPAQQRRSIVGEMNESLERLYGYDPAKFMKIRWED